uniref:Cms1 ribosomal small subunit homolog n=1 Tax=Sphaeramia orbicularis TaxID=375764 RepID=A0A673CPM6_9TELE
VNGKFLSFSEASGAEEEKEQVKEQKEKPNAPIKAEKRKRLTEKEVKAKKKKTNVQVCHQSCRIVSPQSKHLPTILHVSQKKKTITDVLSTSEPKAGCPADLQNLVTQYFTDKRSVIEQEELKLEDSCFLSSNDLTHSLSSYLKQICPKWAKIQKHHDEKSSVVLLIVCSSALRAIELLKTRGKVVFVSVLSAQVEEQVKMLQKGITHIGVGTPGRISALIEKEGLSLRALRYLILDWNWRDQKLRRMVDIPEIKVDIMKLLEGVILNGCKEDKVKIGLF